MSAPETIPDDGQLIRPDIDMLHPSPTNPRKSFDGPALAELAESIIANGVMTPILCRVMPAELAQKLNTPAQLEIVAGERRWRASKIAGLADVPVLLRDLTDAQVQTLQVVENLQREGLNSVEEAEGFGQLLAGGMSAPEIAQQVGKSRGYIYAKLKLLALCPDARDALRSGQLLESIAVLIARIPVPALQIDALNVVTARDADSGEPMTFRRAKLHIETSYTKNLAKAPFDLNDTTLPCAPACSECPRNLRNAPESDTSANVCTDLTCYDKKRQEHNIRLLNLPDDTPRIDIPRAPGSIGGPINWTDYDAAGYRLLSSINYHDARPTGSQRSYADWLADNGESVPIAIHTDPFTGDVCLIASKADLIAAAERIAQAQAQTTEQPGLDIATEQPAPTAPAPARAERPAAPASPERKPIPTKLTVAPRDSANDALKLAYIKYRQDIADTIVSNPPLMIAGPLLHMIARYALKTDIEFESDGLAMASLLNGLASQLAGTDRRALSPDTIELMADAIGIDHTALLNKHVPVPEGCARPNENGVYPAQRTLKHVAGKLSIEIEIARTVDGWRGTFGYQTSTSSRSSPITNCDLAFKTDNEAISHSASLLIDYLKKDKNIPASPVKNLTIWLNTLIDTAAIAIDDPTPAPALYRHPEKPSITWSGRGKKPQWVTDWLAKGGSIDELANQSVDGK